MACLEEQWEVERSTGDLSRKLTLRERKEMYLEKLSCFDSSTLCYQQETPNHVCRLKGKRRCERMKKEGVLKA